MPNPVVLTTGNPACSIILALRASYAPAVTNTSSFFSRSCKILVVFTLSILLGNRCVLLGYIPYCFDDIVPLGNLSGLIFRQILWRATNRVQSRFLKQYWQSNFVTRASDAQRRATACVFLFAFSHGLGQFQTLSNA